mmetsp:Transcript_16264/g.54837  ORF Transcript_16264/g.54837 Transcript_16264/m.54837 type:complete len:209 (-) Transcript_16264:266-892(-)
MALGGSGRQFQQIDLRRASCRRHRVRRGAGVEDDAHLHVLSDGLPEEGPQPELQGGPLSGACDFGPVALRAGREHGRNPVAVKRHRARHMHAERLRSHVVRAHGVEQSNVDEGDSEERPMLPVETLLLPSHHRLEHARRQLQRPGHKHPKRGHVVDYLGVRDAMGGILVDEERQTHHGMAHDVRVPNKVHRAQLDELVRGPLCEEAVE